MPQRAIKYAVVDAFTSEAFKGNPAAVCLLEENAEVDKKWMLSVAKEFNTPITAFLSRHVSDAHDDDAPWFRIWWSTPAVEVDLCGHGTVAATHFLFTSDLVKHDIINFVANIGIVTAKKISKADFTLKDGDEKFFVELDFPVVPMVEGDALEPSLPETLNGVSVVSFQKTSAGDLMIELSSGKEVAMLQPNFEEIKKCEERAVIVTGPAPAGSEFDFFTRVFCPKFGFDEDHVCGSVHCALAPLWNKKLNKQSFTSFMASPRSGVLYVELEEKFQRVRIRDLIFSLSKNENSDLSSRSLCSLRFALSPLLSSQLRSLQQLRSRLDLLRPSQSTPPLVTVTHDDSNGSDGDARRQKDYSGRRARLRLTSAALGRIHAISPKSPQRPPFGEAKRWWKGCQIGKDGRRSDGWGGELLITLLIKALSPLLVVYRSIGL